MRYNLQNPFLVLLKSNSNPDYLPQEVVLTSIPEHELLSDDLRYVNDPCALVTLDGSFFRCCVLILENTNY